jgi:hypothetical protein
MKPWATGETIGSGDVYLPYTKTKAAYGQACRAAIINSAARHAINLTTLQARRDYINGHPAKEQLKARVSELWESRNE